MAAIWKTTWKLMAANSLLPSLRNSFSWEKRPHGAGRETPRAEDCLISPLPPAKSGRPTVGVRWALENLWNLESVWHSLANCWISSHEIINSIPTEVRSPNQVDGLSGWSGNEQLYQVEEPHSLFRSYSSHLEMTFCHSHCITAVPLKRNTDDISSLTVCKGQIPWRISLLRIQHFNKTLPSCLLIYGAMK